MSSPVDHCAIDRRRLLIGLLGDNLGPPGTIGDFYVLQRYLAPRYMFVHVKRDHPRCIGSFISEKHSAGDQRRRDLAHSVFKRRRRPAEMLTTTWFDGRNKRATTISPGELTATDAGLTAISAHPQPDVNDRA